MMVIFECSICCNRKNSLHILVHYLKTTLVNLRYQNLQYLLIILELMSSFDTKTLSYTSSFLWNVTTFPHSCNVNLIQILMQDFKKTLPCFKVSTSTYFASDTKLPITFLVNIHFVSIISLICLYADTIKNTGSEAKKSTAIMPWIQMMYHVNLWTASVWIISVNGSHFCFRMFDRYYITTGKTMQAVFKP